MPDVICSALLYSFVHSIFKKIKFLKLKYPTFHSVIVIEGHWNFLEILVHMFVTEL